METKTNLNQTWKKLQAVQAALGASRHFVRNHAIFRTFLVQYPVVFTEDGGGGDDYRELRLDKVDLR